MSWFWKSDLRHNDGTSSAWTAYADEVAEKIERAFQKGQKTMTLDDTYKIDFKEMIQHRKDDKNRQRAIRRGGDDDDDEGNETTKKTTKSTGASSKKRKEPEPAEEADDDAAAPPEAKRRVVEPAMPNLPADVIENVISRSLEDGDALAARAVNKNWNEAVPLPNVTVLATDAFPSIVELPKLLAKTHSVHYEPANSADAASFLQALLHNTTITELQFGATGVEAKILLDLMDVLSHNSRVTSVTFEGLGVQGATAVASKLGSNQSIKTLKAEGNDIKEEGFNAICDALALNKTLESLDLSKNDLENVNTKHLADAMRANSSLRKLSLRECRIFEGYADFFASLADNHGLVELDYYFNDCEIAGLGKLLDALKTNTTLTHLGIGANGLGRAGADEEALATLTRLFTEHPIITHIDLESSDIEDDVAEEIGTALAKNKTLKSLNFKLNTLTDDGIIPFAKAIAVHPAIETLALQSSDGMMTDESLKSFLNALKTNKSLIYLGLEDCEDDSDYKEKIRHILEARPSGKLQVGDDD